MHAPLIQWTWSGLTKLLSRHSVGTYPEMSSHATCQGTLSHSHLSSLSHCGLILALRVELVCMSQSQLKKKKKAQVGTEQLNILPNFSQGRKKPPPPVLTRAGTVLDSTDTAEMCMGSQKQLSLWASKAPNTKPKEQLRGILPHTSQSLFILFIYLLFFFFLQQKSSSISRIRDLCPWQSWLLPAHQARRGQRHWRDGQWSLVWIHHVQGSH